MKKGLGSFSRFVSINEAVSCEVQTHLGKFSPCKVYEKSYGRIFTIFASSDEAVCYLFQTHFGRSPHSRFAKKFLGAISRFLRPKTKLFAVEFRRISEVLCLQGLQKKLRAHFHDLCVQK